VSTHLQQINIIIIIIIIIIIMFLFQETGIKISADIQRQTFTEVRFYLKIIFHLGFNLMADGNPRTSKSHTHTVSAFLLLKRSS